MDERTPAIVARSPWRAVYGAEGGRWLVLTGPADMPPPPTVESLMYLGDPGDLIRLVQARWVAANRKRVQGDLGERLKLRQQTISRYLRGERVSDLPEAGLCWLVAEVCQGGIPDRQV